MDLEKIDRNLDLDLIESKQEHEPGQYLPDFDDFGLVEQLGVMAFDWHQNHGSRPEPCFDLISVHATKKNSSP